MQPEKRMLFAPINARITNVFKLFQYASESGTHSLNMSFKGKQFLNLNDFLF